ncbi:AbrB/MazE/SpoVT family DNA-binding domain-containing protein [Pseudomonas aeruginosa]
MDLKLQNWGNSVSVRLPTQFLKDTGLRVGDSLRVERASPDSVILKPMRAKPARQYKLAELLESCNSEAPESADMVAWDAMRPEGKEML